MSLIRKKRYFVSDLDGTLLGNDPNLSLLTAHTVARVQADGHVFSFSTARSLTSALSVAGQIEWTHPVTVYNGALIMDVTDHSEPQIIDKRLLPDDITKDLIHLGKKRGTSPFLYMTSCFGDEVVHYESGSAGHPFWSVDKNPRFRQVDTLVVPENLDVVVLNFMGNEATLIPLYEELTEKISTEVNAVLFSDTYIDDFFYLEVRHVEANKGDALVRWAQTVGCDVKDVTVFGDQINDLEMFETAGKAVAVDNAVSELKEIATKTTLSNDRDGVATYLMNDLGYV